MKQKEGLLFTIAPEACLEHGVLSGNQVVDGRDVRRNLDVHGDIHAGTDINDFHALLVC